MTTNSLGERPQRPGGMVTPKPSYVSQSNKLFSTTPAADMKRGNRMTAENSITIIKRDEKRGVVRHTSDLYACRTGCCGIFSLLSGVTLMVWFDLFYLIIACVEVLPALEQMKEIACEISKQRNKIPECDDSFHIGIFVVCASIFRIGLLFIKYILGTYYIWKTTFPPKIDYFFLYRGKTGHHMWRVQSAKHMRKRFIWYFIATTISINFELMQAMVINGCSIMFIEDLEVIPN